MAPEATEAQAPLRQINVAQEAKQRQLLDAQKAKTIGGYTALAESRAKRLITGEASDVPEAAPRPLYPDVAETDDSFLTPDQRRAIGLEIQSNVAAVKTAADGAMSAKVEKTGPGEIAYTHLGGTDSTIGVKDEVVAADSDELESAIIHERLHNKEKAKFKNGGGTHALITAESKVESGDLTEVHEGWAVNGEERETGRKSDNRPEVYLRGRRLAQEMEATNEQVWKSVVTETGDLGQLQQAVWQKGLESGRLDRIDLEREAQMTGYHEEARKAYEVVFSMAA